MIVRVHMDPRRWIYIRPDDVCGAIHLRSHVNTDDKCEERDRESDI